MSANKKAAGGSVSNGAIVPKDTLLSRRRILGPAYRLFYDEPMSPVKGDGVWLTDLNGRRYLDAYNNVPVVGHCNPAVVDALARQAGQLNTHTRYLHEGIVSYAERLLAKFPADLDTIMFTCTGSEANDLALRIAFAATARKGVIVTANAYHGVTAAVADISPSLHPVGPNVRCVPAPSTFKGSDAEIAAQFALAVDNAAENLKKNGTPVAALIVDTVFASDGLYLGQGLLEKAAERVRAHGGLFIADEVQGGFARIGATWWAFQRDAVTPDIVTMGKPMGNGHPVAGVVARCGLVTEFSNDCRYFNTFGGNTVSTAVGLAVLDELERIGALDHVAKVGAAMHDALRTLARRHSIIHDIRGRGLYWGVEIRHPEGDVNESARVARKIVNGMRRGGVLIGTSGLHGTVLKIRPPLVFQHKHLAILMAALEDQCRSALD